MICAIAISAKKDEVFFLGTAILEASSEAEALGFAQRIGERLLPLSQGYTERHWSASAALIDPETVISNFVEK